MVYFLVLLASVVLFGCQCMNSHTYKKNLDLERELGKQIAHEDFKYQEAIYLREIERLQKEVATLKYKKRGK